MICVSLGRTRHRMMLAEHQALAQRGAQLVELRLDWLGRTPEIGRLIKDRPTPVIMTIRRPADGGRWRGDETARLALLRQAIVAGVEYVDLESDAATAIRRYGKTKRIVSFHDFHGTPDNLEEIHAELAAKDADIVKVVTTAQSPADNVRLLQLAQKAKVPTIAFCMGEIGLMSRILCGRFGSPFTYTTFSSDRVLAPGQIVFDEMKNLYRFDSIGPETKLMGVLGDPISHSYSPRIHNAALQKDGLNAVYVPLRVPADQLLPTVKGYSELGFSGFSVTIPHKEGIIAAAEFRDPMVDEIGAANTLFRDAIGKWHATNTDYDAALAAMHLGLQAKGDSEFAGKRALILGAGGVAKAIGLGLVKAGAAVTIANRSKARGTALAEQLGCQYVGWENRGAAFADILVNCTPIGMSPNMDDTPFQENWFREGMIVFDTIYNPENTLFLKQARERLAITVSGLEMFVLQAAAQYQHFTGQPAPLDVMRETLRRTISAVRANT
jgi:3-dehydroquinate dehydratase/shikimate dehydrogenase